VLAGVEGASVALVKARPSMVDPCRSSFHPPAKTNPVVPMVRKEVEVFVLVAVAGVGCRLARLLIEPSPRAVTALLGTEKEEGDRLGAAPMLEPSCAASCHVASASHCRCAKAAVCCLQWTWMPMREREGGKRE
jgi:hypothetical protein